MIYDVIEGIVGQHGVPGRNECAERLREVCKARVASVKSFTVYKYTWVRNVEGRVVDRSLMSYLLLPK